MSVENSVDVEDVACEGCGALTASHDLFEFRSKKMCPVCRKKFLGGSLEAEKRLAERLDKEDAEWERSISRKPLRVSIKNTDRNGVSRIIVRPNFLWTLVSLGLAVMVIKDIDSRGLADLKTLISSSVYIKHLIALIVFSGFALFMLYYKTTIRLNQHELQVKNSLSIFSAGSSRISLQEIVKVWVDTFRIKGGRTKSSSPTWEIYVKTKSGEQYTILRGQSKVATYFIEKKLKEMLSERGYSLSGEG